MLQACCWAGWGSEELHWSTSASVSTSVSWRSSTLLCGEKNTLNVRTTHSTYRICDTEEGFCQSDLVTGRGGKRAGGDNLLLWHLSRLKRSAEPTKLNDLNTEQTDTLPIFVSLLSYSTVTANIQLRMLNALLSDLEVEVILLGLIGPLHQQEIDEYIYTYFSECWLLVTMVTLALIQQEV